MCEPYNNRAESRYNNSNEDNDCPSKLTDIYRKSKITEEEESSTTDNIGSDENNNHRMSGKRKREAITV